VTYFTLQFWRGLTNERCLPRTIRERNIKAVESAHMIYQTIFRRIMLRFESAEKRLFCTQDLDGTCRVLGQAEQTTCMADQPCAHELSNECSQIRRDGVHAIAQIFSQLCSVR